MPELKLYTVAQLREWLMHNHAAEGLSEQIIAPSRAWAIIHNPYVKDDDAIVAAIFEDGELAAYTASFPDVLDGKRVWWASTLYCYPKFTGKGYGMIVVGSLKEAHEPELTYDRWGAQETIEIFNHFGYQTTYTTRYHLFDKKINKSSLKGKLAYVVQLFQKSLHPWSKPSKANYTLRYASYIDGESYAFMQEHRKDNLWLREQDMLNWILRYPFKQSCALIDRIQNDTAFSSNVISFAYQVVKVYECNLLRGVYILRKLGDEMSVIYLYFEQKYKNIVFLSVVDHIISYRPQELFTDNKDLLEFVRKRLYFPKVAENQVSLSLPKNQNNITEFSLQLGDGDSFA